jgi:hypothetical protein
MTASFPFSVTYFVGKVICRRQLSGPTDLHICCTHVPNYYTNYKPWKLLAMATHSPIYNGNNYKVRINSNIFLSMMTQFLRSRYSDWLRTGRRRDRSSSPGRVKNFLFSTSSRPALGPTQPPNQWVPGVLSPGVKRPGNEADHSPPTSAEVKKMWIYTSNPPYAFVA